MLLNAKECEEFQYFPISKGPGQSTPLVTLYWWQREHLDRVGYPEVKG